MNTKQTKTIFIIGLIAVVFSSCSSTGHTQVGRGCMSRFFVGYAKNEKVSYKNSIHNPQNAEFVEEVAFNLDIRTNEVTQHQFNIRYGIK